MRTIALTAVLLLASCQPYACWWAPALSSSDELVLRGTNGHPKAPVRVLVDDIGVPHISGESDPDLVYGLAFMHARDRLFQMVLVRAIASGRLAEILGDMVLQIDQRSRFFAQHLDAQLEALSEEEVALVEAYVAGANDGAAHAGPTVEMALLGIDWEPMTVRDVLLISRLQAKGLSSGLEEELARARILNRIPADDPRRGALLACHDAGGVSVTSASGEGGESTLPPWPWSNTTKARERTRMPEGLRQLIDAASWRGGGSNAWAMHGEGTSTGNAMLMHDPHLGHSLPSLFYLAHLQGPDVTAAGATLPGLPIVGIGHGEHVAWGVPLSYVDTIDLVRIEVDPTNPGQYLVDGEPLPFETSEQTFRLGSEDDAQTVTETWRSTVFGPVLPESAFAGELDEGDVYSMLWSPFVEPEAGAAQLSAFWRLARAKDFDEARDAIEALRVPPMSFTLAFTDGSVGFFPSAALPARASDASPSVPRDGSRSDAGWSGFYPTDAKPQLHEPAAGYVVAANQPLVDHTDPRTAYLGCDGAPTYRARRIHDLIGDLIADKRPSAAELLAIQQDITSLQAQELASIFSEACPTAVPDIDDAFVGGFCEELRRFDGVHDLETTGAIPFRAIVFFTERVIAGVHVDDFEVGAKVSGLVPHAMERAIREWGEGQQPLLLDDPRTDGYDGLGHFMTLAMPFIFELFDRGFGTSPSDWRYGTHHVRYLDSPLAEAIPVLGPWLFGAGAYEETGCNECVRAEGGFPVTFGAVLRMSAEMSSPPDVRFVLAGGQSGRLGHPHVDDQYVAWQSGTPFRVALTERDLAGHIDGRVRLVPP